MHDIPETLRIWTEGSFDCQTEYWELYIRCFAGRKCARTCNLTCQAEKNMILELCQIRIKLHAAVSASRQPIGRQIRDSVAPQVYIVHEDCHCCSDL